jgi:hypothetical protein
MITCSLWPKWLAAFACTKSPCAVTSRLGRSRRCASGATFAYAKTIRALPPAGHADRRPASYRWPPPEDIARRAKIIEEMLATRAQMKPLGMSTAQLIREGRDELERRGEPEQRLGS